MATMATISITLFADHIHIVQREHEPEHSYTQQLNPYSFDKNAIYTPLYLTTLVRVALKEMHIASAVADVYCPVFFDAPDAYKPSITLQLALCLGEAQVVMKRCLFQMPPHETTTPGMDWCQLLRPQQAQRLTPWASACALTTLLLCGTLGLVTWGKYRQKAALHTKNDAAQDAADNARKTLAQYHAYANIGITKNNMSTYAEYLNLLSSALPEDTYLTCVRFQPAAITITGKTANALSVEAFIEKLLAHASMSACSLLSIQRNDRDNQESMLTFNLDARPTAEFAQKTNFC